MNTQIMGWQTQEVESKRMLQHIAFNSDEDDNKMAHVEEMNRTLSFAIHRLYQIFAFNTFFCFFFFKLTSFFHFSFVFHKFSSCGLNFCLNISTFCWHSHTSPLTNTFTTACRLSTKIALSIRSHNIICYITSDKKQLFI